MTMCAPNVMHYDRICCLYNKNKKHYPLTKSPYHAQLKMGAENLTKIQIKQRGVGGERQSKKRQDLGDNCCCIIELQDKAVVIIR